MQGIRAGIAVVSLVAASFAADVQPRWRLGPRKAVPVAALPGSAAQALSLRPQRDGSVLVGWLGGAPDAVVVQKVSAAGAPLWGPAGVEVRSGVPCLPAGDARIHAGGPVDLLPAARGGAWVAWSEGSGAREVRIQRIDGRGR